MIKLAGLVWVASLSLTLISPGLNAEEEYTRTVNYKNDILVRCPDKNKASVQVLVDHADVWHVGKESVDMRIDRRQFARVQAYFSECAIVIQDMEAHVQAAEAKMFPTKKAEQSEWIKAVIQAALPNSNLKDCEAKAQEMEASIQKENWFNEYHSYSEIVNWYKDLAQTYSSIMTFNPSIGKTHEGRDMPCIHFTGSNGENNKKKFYMQCQIHAREWISGATCMYIAEQFVKSYGKDTAMTKLMDELEFVLMPFVNPDGYVYTWTNDRMWRKNRFQHPDDKCVGVDINRNFPDGFKQKKDTCAEDYGGPGPKSELETQHIIKNFRNNAPIIGSIDFHSYGELILRPYGKSNETIEYDGFHRRVGAEMVDIIKKVHGVTYTSEHSYDLYYCYGIAADWLYSDDAAKDNGGYRSASLCIELRDTARKHGFLLPADEITPTGEEMLPAVIHYAQEVLKTPLIYHPSPSLFSFSAR